MDILRQSACLVVNPITVYSYDFLFQFNSGRGKDLNTLISDIYPRPCILISIPFKSIIIYYKCIRRPALQGTTTAIACFL